MSTEISVEAFPWRKRLLAFRGFGVVLSAIGDLGMFYMLRAELEAVENPNISNEKLFAIAGAVALVGIVVAGYSEHQLDYEKAMAEEETSANTLAAEPVSLAIPHPTLTEDLYLFMPPGANEYAELG